MKRHNKVIEKLTKEKEKCYERTVERKNKIALLRQELIDANKNLDDTNIALHNLRTARDELYEDKEPTLDNYYEPSEEMKSYWTIVTGLIGTTSGYLITKLL